MAQAPTSPEWWQYRTPDALPYGMHRNCYVPCPPVPEGQLQWWPSCLCTHDGPGQAFPAPPLTAGPPGGGGEGGEIEETSARRRARAGAGAAAAE